MSRDAILAEVRAALRRTGGAGSNFSEKLPLPASARGDGAVLAARFASALEAQGTLLLTARIGADVPAAIAGFLAGTKAAPVRVRCGADDRLTAMPWDTVPGVVRIGGPAEPGDAVSLSHAVAGIAETGTLVLASGSGDPTSLAFLAETHIIALAHDAIVGSYEDAFAILRRDGGGQALPRAVNLISGASRTGDIGGRIVMGAHGPRRLAVVVYGALAGLPGASGLP